MERLAPLVGDIVNHFPGYGKTCLLDEKILGFAQFVKGPFQFAVFLFQRFPVFFELDMGIDTGVEFGDLYGFGDIVDGSRLERFDLVKRITERR